MTMADTAGTSSLEHATTAKKVPAGMFAGTFHMFADSSDDLGLWQPLSALQLLQWMNELASQHPELLSLIRQLDDPELARQAGVQLPKTSRPASTKTKKTKIVKRALGRPRA